jgi:hypothetical protein
MAVGGVGLDVLLPDWEGGAIGACHENPSWHWCLGHENYGHQLNIARLPFLFSIIVYTANAQ